MNRQEILSQAKKNFGMEPDWMNEMPDTVLEQYWATLSWVLADTKMTARDKALVAFGAASAIHCGY